jgi:hypothetical protein
MHLKNLCYFKNYIDSSWFILGCQFLQLINLFLIHNSFFLEHIYFLIPLRIYLKGFASKELIDFYLIYYKYLAGLCLNFSIDFTAKTFIMFKSNQPHFTNLNYFNYSLKSSCQYLFDSMISFCHLLINLHFY